MTDIATALNKLSITEWVLYGEPKNEEEFNSMFRKVVGVNENGTAKKSDNPKDFGITWTEVKAKQDELLKAEPMRLLRLERNRKLAETDWRASSDLTLSSEWTTYRQALRDLPSTATPTLDDDGNLQNVTWPNEPT